MSLLGVIIRLVAITAWVLVCASMAVMAAFHVIVGEGFTAIGWLLASLLVMAVGTFVFDAYI